MASGPGTERISTRPIVCLGTDPDSLAESDRARRAEIYRQVLSLLLAQRRPSFYLASGSGQEALKTLTDQYLRQTDERTG